MAKVVFDGKYKVYLVETIEDREAPTVAEIDAGTDITTECPKDFLSWGKNQGRVDGGDISTLFSAESMGTWTMAGSMQVFLDDDGVTSPAFNEIDLLTRTHLVILPYGGSGTDGAAAADDSAYVAFVEFGQPTPTSPAENQRQRAEVDFAVQYEPSFSATIAAA